MGGKARSAMTPEMLERFRQVGIRLDRNGRFWHEGAEVTHRGLHRTLLSWLDRLEDGRRILRLDAERYAYVEVEDADFQVVSVQWTARGARLVLNDATTEALDPTSLRTGAGNEMYCDVKAGRMTARFATKAYYLLAEKVEQRGDGFVVRLGNDVFPIATPT